MMKLLGIALGAGVTSAVLFAVTTTASPAALLLAYLAPLPIMIVGLGFAHPAGAAAALIGGGTVGLAMGPVAGLLFLVALGLPAWYLARLAVLGRPVAVIAGQPGGQAPVEWFPIAPLMLRLAGLATAPVLLAGALLIWRYGGYEAALDRMSSLLASILARDSLPGEIRFLDLIRLAPVAMAASGAVMLAANLWLAGRAVKISDRLPRPWPNLPDAMRMPRPAAVALAVLVAGSFLPDPFGLGLAAMASGLGMVFVFEGLATAHVLTRGLSARGAILAAIYLVTLVVMPWPLFALALLGCIDCLVPRLRRSPGPLTTNHPKGRH